MNAILKRLKSRTYQFAGLLVASGLVEAYTGQVTALIQAAIPEGWRWLVGPLIGVAVAGLREITKTPLSEK